MTQRPPFQHIVQRKKKSPGNWGGISGSAFAEMDTVFQRQTTSFTHTKTYTGNTQKNRTYVGNHATPTQQHISHIPLPSPANQKNVTHPRHEDIWGGIPDSIFLQLEPILPIQRA